MKRSQQRQQQHIEKKITTKNQTCVNNEKSSRLKVND